VSAQPRSLVLVGAGKMGSALLSGWLAMGVEGASMTALEPAPSPATSALCHGSGIRLASAAESGLPAPEALVIALKPQAFGSAAADFAFLAGPHTLVLSIMAGKTLADLRRALPGASAYVRAMPNTPAAIGRGVSGLVAAPGASPEQLALADALLCAVGGVEWLADESLMDAVTALSGSGPAYVFYLAECMAQAGEAAGLPCEIAQRLARSTVEGASALMASEPDVSPADLRAAVTSPGGTTQAALDVLRQADGLASLIGRAVEAAKRRAGELSG